MTNLRSLILLFIFGSTAFAQTAKQDWLDGWLSQNAITPATVGELRAAPEAKRALTKTEAASAADRLWAARKKVLRDSRAAEMKARVVELDGKKMPFWYKVFGDKPEGGRSLFISMHGGGGAPARVNDGQYENQKRLYQPAEGVYLVPRAPTNTWNLWHQAHIDGFFDRLITNMVVFEDVDPNKVYFMGYSAGGDGVYQLAPRMADRLAAAAMMAGHPNETTPDGLRNIGFTLHMGGRDAAYKRNQIARDWKEKLAKLREGDPDGYAHEVVIHEQFGHWMNRKDAVAVPWMAKFQRNPFPKKIVWKQDDVTHRRFYWLAAEGENRKARSRVVARVNGNIATIEESDLKSIDLLFSDRFVDLDKPICVFQNDKVLLKQKLDRTVATIAESLLERDDPAAIVSAKVTVGLATQAE